MRVRPRPLVGVLVLIAYLAVFYGVWIVNGIDYDRIGDSGSTLLRWYVAPLLCGAALLVALTTYLGWWRPAMFESAPRTPAWTALPGAVMVVVAVAMLLSTSFAHTTGQMWAYLAIGSVGVGFSEELATRGVLLTGLRGRFTEPWAWCWSTALFGLLHLPNGVFGEGPGAIAQVFVTAALGTAFYLVRRASGSLLPAMLLHGFWDFSTFAGDDKPAWAVGVVPLVGLGALACAWVLLRRERGQRLGTTVGAGTPATSAIA